ncbi:MAG: hypothetical protein XU10_C0015G0048 [Chloroflexi bacterium CSP1-4]|nr:MAG: hypothetical protein XU10_C0015G0048 [Chloroflexi bacterium CSP1-4]
MADLTAVPGHPGERLAIDDQATADADFSGDEQDVVHAHGRPPPDLGQRADVRLVGDGDGRGRVERSRESLTEGDITPAEVRCHRDEPVGAPDDADDGHADPDEGAARRRSGADGGRQLDEVGDDLIDREVAAGPVDADEVEDLTAQPDRGCGKRIDCDLEGQDDGALRIQADQG